MTALQRLEALLDQKDAELDKADRLIEDLRNQIRGLENGWTRHLQLPSEQTLPVPRLEMRICGTEDRIEWVYLFVYRHFLGHCEGVPLGQTVSSGRHAFPPRGFDGRLKLPFRDGAHFRHDARTLRFPAFVSCGDVVERLLEADDGNL